ncbi:MULTISPECIES: hypothetical protein [unclassified Sphingomonas]|uniref:hypothetical protein n=1 Tax=unclassified Sphingomonas TaxID=196159 RepID=UPI00226A3E84|nr:MULTISPECIES: hypothetical protein [unclassified Sphingomonas]
MDDTQHLLSLVHGVGFEVVASEDGSRLDCPFCDDRIDLCTAWLAGFSTGRLTRTRSNPAHDNTNAGNANIVG